MRNFGPGCLRTKMKVVINVLENIAFSKSLLCYTYSLRLFFLSQEKLYER